MNCCTTVNYDCLCRSRGLSQQEDTFIDDRRSRTRLTSLKVWLVLLVSQLLQRERFEIQLLMSIDIQKIFHNV